MGIFEICCQNLRETLVFFSMKESSSEAERSMIFNGNRYLCTSCPFSTDATSTIRMHSQKCHSAFIQKKSSKVVSRPKFKGRVNASGNRVTINLSSSRELRRPKATTSSKKPVQCSFKTEASIPKKSSKVVSRPKFKGRVNASERRVTFNLSSSRELRRPKATTSSKKPVQCSFKTEGENFPHSILRIKEQYNCNQCDARFHSQTELFAHKNNMHLKYPGLTACDICSEKFPSLNTMLYHRRIHLQSQSFTCSFCQKKFYDVIVFRNHEVLHKGDIKKKQ